MFDLEIWDTLEKSYDFVSDAWVLKTKKNKGMLVAFITLHFR